MYLTKIHKDILDDIWRGGEKHQKGKVGNAYNINKFLQFLNKRRSLSNPLFEKPNTKNQEYYFAGYKLDHREANTYGILLRNKLETILVLNEFSAILDYLNKNELIYVMEKKDDSSLCPALYLISEEKADEPFNEALKVVRMYIGKEIIVREGYKKFKRFNYTSHEEYIRTILYVVIPLLAAFIMALATVVSIYKDKH